MHIGMNLPVMAPGLDRERFINWCRLTDQGPFRTLAAGERIAFYNPDLVAAMGSAAMLTERVKLALTVLVPLLHDPVLTAKRVATLDVLSGGRIILGLGVGGREEDYQAVNATFDQRRLSRMERFIARMREVWAQATIVEGAFPVGPEPVQEGGPPLFAGSLMETSIRRAAKWADGISGFDFGPNKSVVEFQLSTARSAWTEAGRDAAPYVQAACWYALGSNPRAQIEDYLGRYLRFLGPDAPNGVSGMVRCTSASALREVVAELEELGVDELLLVPTSSDERELNRVAEALV